MEERNPSFPKNRKHVFSQGKMPGRLCSNENTSGGSYVEKSTEKHCLTDGKQSGAMHLLSVVQIMGLVMEKMAASFMG